MNMAWRQAGFALLSGIAVGVLGLVLVGPNCWSPMVGIFVATYLAKTASPAQGAGVGAVVMIPIAFFALLRQSMLVTQLVGRGEVLTVVGMMLGVLMAAGLGAAWGWMIGKLFQWTAGKGLMF